MLCLLILVAVALSYIHNEPPFRGFALVGVVLYVVAFFFVLSFITFREMYLCQGIFFLALPEFHLPWYAFVVLLLAGDIACAWACKRLVDVVQERLLE